MFQKDLALLIRSRIWFFALGGFLVFLYEWLFTVLLNETFYIHYHVSYIIALFTGLIFLFLFHKKITFKSNEKIRFSICERFLFIYLTYYLFNWIFVYFLSQKINYIFAIPLVSFFLGFFSYFLNKRLVFSSRVQ